MKIPEEFIELCGYIDGLSRVEEDSVSQWVAGAVSQFNHMHPQKEGADTVRQFLDELLSGNHDGAELQEVWHRTGAGFFIADQRELLQFLALVRDKMDRSQAG
jgi:hypothetical protein